MGGLTLKKETWRAIFSEFTVKPMEIGVFIKIMVKIIDRMTKINGEINAISSIFLQKKHASLYEQNTKKHAENFN